jgi:peptidoglycan/LPS O-acetylase OafA/YrhL
VSEFRLAYTPALDGLRALAIISVVAFHGDSDIVPGGWIGVDIFFALSGFLITSLLLQEWQDSSGIDLASFYKRRAMRLFPALFLLVAVTGLYESFYQACPGTTPFADRAFYGLTFFSNWFWAFGDNSNPLCGFYALWSLAIEEQFYIAWPLALAWLLRCPSPIKTTALVLGGVLAASFLWRLYLWSAGVPDWRIVAGTDTHADPILIGCGVALAAFSLPRKFWEDRCHMISLGAPFALAALLTLMLREGLPNAELMLFVYTLLGLLTAWVLVGVAVRPVRFLAAALSWWPLVYIGKVSYGLFLWHSAVGIYADAHFPNLPYIVKFAVFVLATLCSYYLVELPCTRLARAQQARSPA